MSRRRNTGCALPLPLVLIGLVLVPFVGGQTNSGEIMATPTPRLYVASTPRPTPAQTSTPAIYAKVKSGVNIRSDATADSEKVSHASQGEMLIVTQEYYNPKWHQILYDGEVRYVSANYCEITGPPTPSPSPTPSPGSYSNPIVVTAENLSKAVAKDKSAAKDKYWLKYVKLSGKVIYYQAYRTRSCDGKNYHYEGHVIYWFSNNDLKLASKLIPIKVTMSDVSKYYGRGNKIEIIGHVSSISDDLIEITDGRYK